MKTKRLLPTTYLLIAMIVMVAMNFLFPVAMIIPPLWNLLGILLVILGILIDLAADRQFHRASTTVKPFEESNALVTDGIFRITRNPMYLGFVIVLIGIAILLRSLSPYLVIIAFVILIQRMFITVEEHMLAEKFGESWRVYQQSTRQWL